MAGIYARRAISLNAETLEFLAYSSNRLAGQGHVAMMMTGTPALETVDVISP
jgi:hypothetical protein